MHLKRGNDSTRAFHDLKPRPEDLCKSGGPTTNALHRVSSHDPALCYLTQYQRILEVRNRMNR